MPAAATASSASSPSTRSRVGVGPVGQQGEMQIAVGAGEVVDLEALDLLLDRLPASSAASARRRACAGAAGTPSRSSRPAAALALKAEGDGAIDQRDRRIDGRDRAESAEQPQAHGAPSPAMASASSGAASRTARRTAMARRIAADADRPIAAAPATCARRGRKPIAASKARRPAGDEMIAGIAPALVGLRRRDSLQRLSPPRPRGGRSRVSAQSEPRASSSMALR